MARKKTWREKLDGVPGLPKVEPIPDRMKPRWGEGTILVPAPRDVDAAMRLVPEGWLVEVNDIRAALAARHGADIACPMTTGISVVISARAAEESAALGDGEITPYWRTLKAGGQLNPKYPGGVEAQRAKLASEGHRVVQKGKRWLVSDWRARRFRLPI